MKTLIQPLRSRAFKTQNLNESLQAAEMYGSLLHTVDIGQYDDPALEQALTDAAEAALPSLAPVADKRDCLHIISEAYIIGGHTRLMEKLAGMHTEKPDLLITRSADEKALARCNSVFSTVYEIKSVELLEKIA